MPAATGGRHGVLPTASGQQGHGTRGGVHRWAGPQRWDGCREEWRIPVHNFSQLGSKVSFCFSLADGDYGFTATCSGVAMVYNGGHLSLCCGIWAQDGVWDHLRVTKVSFCFSLADGYVFAATFNGVAIVYGSCLSICRRTWAQDRVYRDHLRINSRGL